MRVARPMRPGNLSHLQRLIAEIADVGGEVKRIQRAIANTIVGQMLPPGVVKGGTAMKLRLGEAHSRFTETRGFARCTRMPHAQAGCGVSRARSSRTACLSSIMFW